MIQARLRYIGLNDDGRACLCSTNSVTRAEMETKLKPGEHCKVSISRRRSTKHHRLFFAKLNRLWENLHETDARFVHFEHFRAWVLVQAGHCDITALDVPEDADMGNITFLLMAIERASKGVLFFYQTADGFAVATARSIDFSNVDQDEFNKLDERVNHVIQNELNTDPDALIKSIKEDVN